MTYVTLGPGREARGRHTCYDEAPSGWTELGLWRRPGTVSRGGRRRGAGPQGGRANSGSRRVTLRQHHLPASRQ